VWDFSATAICEVFMQGLEDRFARHLAGIADPSRQRRDVRGSVSRHDAVFDRAEQHVGDRCDEGDQDENQQAAQQEQRAEFLPTQGAREGWPSAVFRPASHQDLLLLRGIAHARRFFR
jgi:hypothetical protein